MYDIIIPSCKAYEDIKLHTQLIKTFDREEFNYIPTGFNASASVNRNYGLMKAFDTINEYIIMIDDDIGGFYTGWQHDLVEPLKTDVNIAISSARLITPDGNLSPMMGVDNCIDRSLSIADKAILSASIAIRKSDIIDNPKLRFCMGMVGSGWEDTLFCQLIKNIYKRCEFVCVNKCRLIHYHEMKKQSEHFEFNYRVYKSELAKEGIHE